MKYRYIAVDFDETLSMNGNFPIPGTPSRGIAVLKKFRENGGKVILWTCRSDEHLQMALDFCKENGLEFDAIGEHLQEQIDEWKALHPDSTISPKVFADMYIDDKDPRTIIFGYIDWDLIDYLLNGTSNWRAA